MEVDKIDVAAEQLCNNEHSKTYINEASEEQISIEQANHVEQNPDDFEASDDSLFVGHEDVKLFGWNKYSSILSNDADRDRFTNIFTLLLISVPTRDFIAILSALGCMSP